MIKKRLIGVVTVKDGWAVQSFGYRRYLPLGRPEVLVENLDRWGADEILLQCIDRSAQGAGPDFKLLERVSHKGLSTPLIYAGGIRTVADGIAVTKAGADRICVDSLLHDDTQVVADLSEPLGAQAIIGAFPLAMENGAVLWLDHRSVARKSLTPEVLALLRSGTISEALIIDWQHEGMPGGFDMSLLTAFPGISVPLIAFGGLSDVQQLRSVLQSSRTVAAAIGNFLSYREHAVQTYKQQLAGLPLRAATYDRSLLS